MYALHRDFRFQFRSFKAFEMKPRIYFIGRELIDFKDIKNIPTKFLKATKMQ